MKAENRREVGGTRGRRKGNAGKKRNAERGQEKSGDGKEAEQFKFAEEKVG